MEGRKCKDCKANRVRKLTTKFIKELDKLVLPCSMKQIPTDDIIDIFERNSSLTPFRNMLKQRGVTFDIDVLQGQTEKLLKNSASVLLTGDPLRKTKQLNYRDILDFQEEEDYQTFGQINIENKPLTEVVFSDQSIFRGVIGDGVSRGEVVFHNLFIYRGDIVNEKFHGRGEILFMKGHKIQGLWEQGEIVSKARVVYPMGQIYFGQLLQFQRHRQGHLFFPDGSKYEGEFRHGEMTGYGVYYSSSGDKTSGYWIEGEYNGINERLFQKAKAQHRKTGRSKRKKKNGQNFSQNLSTAFQEGKLGYNSSV